MISSTIFIIIGILAVGAMGYFVFQMFQRDPPTAGQFRAVSNRVRRNSEAEVALENNTEAIRRQLTAAASKEDADIAALQALIAALTSGMGPINAAIAALQTDQTNDAASLAALLAASNIDTTMITNLTTAIAAAQTSINLLTTELNADNTTLGTLQNQVAALHTALGAAQSSINAIQIALVADESNISNNSTAITGLQNRATADETKITNLQTNQTNDETDIANNSTAITALQTRATNDETSITNLQNSLNSLSSSVTSIQTNLTNLTTQVNTNTSNITSLQSSRTTDEMNIATLQSQVAALQAASGGSSPQIFQFSSGPTPMSFTMDPSLNSTYAGQIYAMGQNSNFLITGAPGNPPMQPSSLSVNADQRMLGICQGIDIAATAFSISLAIQTTAAYGGTSGIDNGSFFASATLAFVNPSSDLNGADGFQDPRDLNVSFNCGGNFGGVVEMGTNGTSNTIYSSTYNKSAIAQALTAGTKFFLLVQLNSLSPVTITNTTSFTATATMMCH